MSNISTSRVKRWFWVVPWAVIILMAVGGVLIQQILFMPYPRWKAGDKVCLTLNGKVATVSSTFRYASGVTYYLTTVDDLNHVYELKVSETELQPCPGS
jgi:hypothetical protein